MNGRKLAKRLALAVILAVAAAVVVYYAAVVLLVGGVASMPDGAARLHGYEQCRAGAGLLPHERSGYDG